MLDLNGVRLRNRVVTSSSLLGYGAPRGRLVLYGMSPIAQWVPLERFGAVGGFSADEFCALVDVVNERAAPGEIAAVEFNVSCHNVNFPFEPIVEDVLATAVRRSRHPVVLKLSPDYDCVAHARLAERYGVAALVAINT